MMAVQPIFKKKITKYDLSDPNYNPKSKPKVEVSGNEKSDDDDIYGEKKHTYQPDNGNLQIN